MKRIGMPDEIAGVAVMLASEPGSYINGQYRSRWWHNYFLKEINNSDIITFNI